MVHEEEETLHLLKMAPLSMLRDGGFDWKNAPTWFGDLSLAARYDEKTKKLWIDYRAHLRQKPVHTLLHLPSFEGMVGVIFNGKLLDRTKGTVAV